MWDVESLLNKEKNIYVQMHPKLQEIEYFGRMDIIYYTQQH